MKSILKQPVKFELGKLYPLEDIRRQTAFFKTKADLATDKGLFHLYAHRVDGTCWVGGPFTGPDSNFFMYLGLPKSQDDLRALVAKIRAAKPPVAAGDDDLYAFDGDGSVAASTGGFGFSLLNLLDDLTFDWD